MRVNKTILLLAIPFFVLGLSCQKKATDTGTTEPVASDDSKYLYFSAGGCYVGTLTGTRPVSTTASGFISRISVDSGQIQGVPIFDLYQSGLNLWSVGITNYDEDHFLANIATSTAGFRIDKIRKDGLQQKEDYLSDVTNLTGVLRNINLLSDGSILVSRSTIVEKYNSSRVRITNTPGTASFISNPAGSCTGSNTLASSVLPLPNGSILYTHAGGATNNRIVVIDSAGYDAAADCKGALTFNGTSSPATVAVPTAAVLVPNTDPYQIIVSTASSTAGNDQIYLFTVNSTTNAVTFVKSLYNDNAYVRGVSAMTFDPETNELYVANGSTMLGNTIEKLVYNSTAQTLTRSSTFMG
jgi:hypothetical protein